MIEILSVLETQDDFIKYHAMIDKHNTDNDIKRIILWLDNYYRDTKATDVDWSSFSTYFFSKNPMIGGTKKEVFESIFEKLDEGCTTLKSALIDTYLQRYHAERIAFHAMSVAEGKKPDLLDIQLELDTYLDVSGKAAAIGEEANRDDLETILTKVIHGTGLRWRLTPLNTSLGPLRLGNFVLFAGRPDAGKTTLLLSEVTYMAEQLPDDKTVLYFSNEEASSAVKLRAMCSLLGVTLGDLERDPLTYWNEYVKILGREDKILIIEKPDLSVNDINWWIKREDAGLIVVDQMRKVKGFDSDSGITRLEKIFNYARELSKSVAPVLTVSQLDGQAEGEAYPSMSRLYESKTAVQGEMDAIVNIGVVAGSVPANARYLNVVKNKLPTPDDPMMRKAQYEVLLHADIARFI